MDVTVNIRGNSQPFQEALDQVANSPDPSPGRASDTSRPPVLPPSYRLVEEMRKEIEAQRGTSATSNRRTLEELAKQQRETIDRSISDRYSARRQDVQTRLESEYEGIDKKMEELRKRGLRNLGSKSNDPFYQSVLNQQVEAERERRYTQAGKKYDEEFENIDKEEQVERNTSENELTEALKRLTEEIQKGKLGGRDTDSDSYINRLREQRRQLLWERDNAPDEAGATTAQGNINKIDERLRSVMGGGQSRNSYDPILQGSMGMTNVVSGMQSGSVGGTILGAGSAIAGFSGMSGAAAMKFMTGVGIAVSIAEIAQKSAEVFSKTYKGLGDLSVLRGTVGEGEVGARGVRSLEKEVRDEEVLKRYGLSYNDLGIDKDEFGSLALRRIRGRGTSEDWVGETLQGVAAEHHFGLQKDALIQGGQYDRYGQNVTQALYSMVSILQSIDKKGIDSGVSANDFTRVQEKFDIQQQIMGSYMSRTDRPDYNNANNLLAAFSSTGVTQDKRVGDEIATFQDMIQNPMNERMRVLIYSTVQDLMPETVGRPDLIQRAINNPDNEGKIMQTVIKAVTAQFGDTHSTSGYFNWKALAPGIADDRLDDIVDSFSNNTTASKILKGKTFGEKSLNQLGAAYSKNKTQILGNEAGMNTEYEKIKSFWKDLTATTIFKVMNIGSGSTSSSPKDGD